MAGGIGAFLAGFGPALAESVERQRRAQQADQLMQMRQAEFGQQQQQRQQEQQAATAAFGALTAGGLPSMGGMQPAPMPSGGVQSGQSVGGGLAAGGALTGGGGPLLDLGVQKLTQLGVNPDVARGALNYAWRNENMGGKPDALNPTSGALGLMQWLGPRKAALTSQYGARPGGEQQLDFMASELQGPESATLAQLRQAKSAKEGYDIWGTSYERPGPAALAKAGVGSGAPVGARGAKIGAIGEGASAKLVDMGTGSPVGAGGDPNAQQSAIPAPVQQQVMQTARAVAPSIPQGSFGAMDITSMARMIEKASPDAPPVVKMMALEKLQNFLAPQQRMAWEQAKTQNSQNFQVEFERYREQLIGEREAARPGTSQVLNDPSNNNTPYLFDPKTRKITTMDGQPYKPGGATKLSTRAPSGDEKITPEEAALAAGQYLAGDTTAVQGWGRGASGDENRVAIRRAITEEAKKRGWSGADIANAVAEFQGNKAAQRALGTREAGLGVGLQEAKVFAPMAIEASDKVDRTQFPTINSLVLAAERGTGDENVVKMGLAVKSLASAYSMVLRRGGMPTDQSQREATALLDMAYSKGQLRAAVEQMMREIEAAEKAPGLVRQQMRGDKGVKAPGGEPAAPAAPAREAAPAAPQQQTQQPGTFTAPLPGVVENGYRFKGGDPKDPANWERVQ